MAAKGVVGIVAGQAAIPTTLVMLVVVSVSGAPVLRSKKTPA